MTSAEPRTNECGTSEAAELLGGCTSQTVRNLIERGELDAHRRQRGARFVWRVDRDSLDAYRRRAGMSTGNAADPSLNERVASLEQRLIKLEARPRPISVEGKLVEEVIEQVRQAGEQHRRVHDLLHESLSLLQRRVRNDEPS